MRSIPLARIRELLPNLPVKYAAILAIGITTGCRISEITALRRGDLLDPATGRLRERIAFQKLKVRQGKRSRDLAIPGEWQKPLLAHLEAEAERGRTAAEDYVFRGKHGRPLSRLTVYHFFRERLGRGFGTHFMRKTFAQEMFRQLMRRYATDPLQALEHTRQALGHVQIQTTMHYLSIDEHIIDEVQREVFENLEEQ